jgi:hypothetical protein
MISKLPIEQQISWLSSHAAGTLKAHSMNETQQDFWLTILNVTNEISALRQRLSRLEDKVEDSGQFRIGG